MTDAAKCDNCGKMVDFDRYHYVIEGIPAEMVRGFHPRSRFDLCSLECIGQWVVTCWMGSCSRPGRSVWISSVPTLLSRLMLARPSRTRQRRK